MQAVVNNVREITKLVLKRVIRMIFTRVLISPEGSFFNAFAKCALNDTININARGMNKVRI